MEETASITKEVDTSALQPPTSTPPLAKCSQDPGALVIGETQPVRAPGEQGEAGTEAPKGSPDLLHALPHLCRCYPHPTGGRGAESLPRDECRAHVSCQALCPLYTLLPLSYTHTIALPKLRCSW